MNLLKDMMFKILETPEVVNQLRKSLVNRDLAIEIDGKRFQIMKRNNPDEVEALNEELTDLKSRLYDVETALKDALKVLSKHRITVQFSTEEERIVGAAKKTLND